MKHITKGETYAILAVLAFATYLLAYGSSPPTVCDRITAFDTSSLDRYPELAHEQDQLLSIKHQCQGDDDNPV